MSPNKHKLRGPGGKYISASERAQLMEVVIISDSKTKVRKVELVQDESDFECSDKSDGKPVYADVEKELAVDKPILELLPNRSEEDETNNNGETGDGDGNISLRKSNQLFKPR